MTYDVIERLQALSMGLANEDEDTVLDAIKHIQELEARLQTHKEGRTNTAEMARAMYQKQCEYVGPQHEEACVTMLTLAFDSFEDRIAELEVEVERLRNLPPEHEVSSGSFDVCPSCKGEKGHYDATSMKGVWHVCHICHGTGRVRDE